MRAAASVALLLLAGCATSVGTLGVAGPDADAIGFKMIRPGARARACRASVLGVPLGPPDPALQDALAQILALDREGDVVTNLEITSRTFTTGIYNRRCVELRGDLGRFIPTVTIPMPAGHGHH